MPWPFPFRRISVDHSRHDGLLDHAIMRKAHVASIGAGGVAGAVTSLLRSGIATWTLIDPDCVSATNPATQGHDIADLGKPKVIALAEKLKRIDPAVKVRTIEKRYQDLTEIEHAALWQADMVLAMTDDFHTQARINRDALRFKTDTLFGHCNTGCEAVEVTATFPDTVARGLGCHRCHTKARYDAYDNGFTNAGPIASHALAADYLNALIGLIVVSRLHQRTGSTLAIANIAEQFASEPCLISRMRPSFGRGPGQAFPGFVDLPFTSTLWSLDTPDGWSCPDCGTVGLSPLPLPASWPIPVEA